MKKTRKLILVALLMFMVAAASGGAYAYWAGTINAPAQKTDDISINIGEGKAINTILTINDPTFNDKLLVPPGQAGYSVVVEGKTNVEEIIVQYTVNWNAVSGSIAGALGTLTMAVTGKTIGTGEDAATLGGTYVKVQVWDPAANDGSGAYTDVDTLTYAIVADGAAVGTKIKVTLLEPPTKAVYDQVKEMAIVVSLSFSVAVI